MYVYYCTFEVPEDNRAAFDEWMIRVTEECQAQDGRVVYEYLTNPARPTQGILIAAWATSEHMDRHRVFPAHVEMAALGSSKWGMHDLRMQVWEQAEGHAEVTFSITDDSADGDLGPLVRERQALEAQASG